MTNEEIARQLEIYLEKLNDYLENCNEEVLLTNEAQKIFKETAEDVKKILPKDTKQYRVFDSQTSRISQWWIWGPLHYVAKQDCEKFKQLINAIQKVLLMYQPEFIEGEHGKTEFHFSKSEVAEAKLRIFETIKKAENTLIIIDPYACQDTEILNYIKSLREIKENLEIIILTERATSIFKNIAKDIKGLEVKKIKDVLHDRYLILDRREVWHLGTSINGVGSGDFTMTKLSDEKEKTRIIEDFDEYWTNAKNLDE
jgi:hypothetical protein